MREVFHVDHLQLVHTKFKSKTLSAVHKREASNRKLRSNLGKASAAALSIRSLGS